MNVDVAMSAKEAVGQINDQVRRSQRVSKFVMAGAAAAACFSIYQPQAAGVLVPATVVGGYIVPAAERRRSNSAITHIVNGYEGQNEICPQDNQGNSGLGARRLVAGILSDCYGVFAMVATLEAGAIAVGEGSMDDMVRSVSIGIGYGALALAALDFRQVGLRNTANDAIQRVLG